MRQVLSKRRRNGEREIAEVAYDASRDGYLARSGFLRLFNLGLRFAFFGWPLKGGHFFFRHADDGPREVFEPLKCGGLIG